ncbi:DUF4142 domain-containing protein [Actinomadura logoneensis]|uniref:DUF4142 domain-containing protein n=1 Tax=Actinomadura logoneensis TaxID=2293572 RepID=A0A372JJZ2_9ACTN|nr:DUF4142 domain-containing protein [Actinomadura logoneensis]RFU40337.1 DUF4142 domain-containing protein [Actinomadura logoneensis]
MSVTRWPAVVAAVVIMTAGTSCGAYDGPGKHAAVHTPMTTRPPTDRLSAQDRAWLAQAHQGNVAEIEAGQLAQDKSGSAQVQNEGATLLKDHTQLDQQVVTTAERLGVSLPTTPTADQAAQQQQLGALTGSEFDNQFVSSMITAHEQAIAATQNEAAHGSDPAVVALAKQSAPVMQQHLTMLKQQQH